MSKPTKPKLTPAERKARREAKRAEEARSLPLSLLFALEETDGQTVENLRSSFFIRECGRETLDLIRPTLDRFIAEGLVELRHTKTVETSGDWRFIPEKGFVEVEAPTSVEMPGEYFFLTAAARQPLVMKRAKVRFYPPPEKSVRDCMVLTAILRKPGQSFDSLLGSVLEDNNVTDAEVRDSLETCIQKELIEQRNGTYYVRPVVRYSLAKDGGHTIQRMLQRESVPPPTTVGGRIVAWFKKEFDDSFYSWSAREYDCRDPGSPSGW